MNMTKGGLSLFGGDTSNQICFWNPYLCFFKKSNVRTKSLKYLVKGDRTDANGVEEV